MYIHIRENPRRGQLQKELTLIVSAISSIESNEDGSSTIFMLNGHNYRVLESQRMLRTQLRKSAQLSDPAFSEDEVASPS